MVLEVLERGADGVQAPGLGHGLLRGRPAALDEDAPVPPAPAAAARAGPPGGRRGRGRGRRRGQQEVGARGREDGVAEAVVEVPDPLEDRLRLRRVPPHRRRGWDGLGGVGREVEGEWRKREGRQRSI